MPHKIRIIILTSVALLGLCYSVVALLWAGKQTHNEVCRVCTIVIVDSTKRQYVSPRQLKTTLQQSGLYPVGNPENEVSCEAIEQCVRTHPMVRYAECYKTPQHGVTIAVQQRRPILRVMGQDGSYFVDSDRKRMPMTNAVHDTILMVTGAVSWNAAQGDYYDFAQWLYKNRYWKKRIVSLHIKDSKHVWLTQQPVNGNIILGSLDDYQSKLHKLEVLYTKGFDIIGYPSYRELDLQYKGQVVGRK